VGRRQASEPLELLVPSGSLAVIRILEPVLVLGEPYYAAAGPVVRLQLQRAGVRLTAVLNNVLQ